MTQQQLVEMVQQHHPNMSETQILLYLNSALEEFCRKTRIINSAFQFTTVQDKRYYDLDGEIIEVTSVDFDGYDIPKLTGRPEKRDIT
jgi:hypothetical protein